MFHVTEIYYFNFEKDAMTIESKYWIEVIIDKTPAMQLWLDLFKNSGIADSEEN